MKVQTDRATDHISDAERLKRCMSMVAHHEEIQVIMTVIDKLLEERKQAAAMPEEDDR